MNLNFSLEQFLEEGALLRMGQDRWVLACGPVQSCAALDPGKPSFFYTNFRLTDSTPWKNFAHCIELSNKDFFNFLNSYSMMMTPFPRQWESPEKTEFERRFTAVKAAIHQGKLEKAVPVVHETSPQSVSKDELLFFLQSLIEVDPFQWPYGFWTPQGGVIGVSPEILFQQNSNEIKTMALAGTRWSKSQGSLLEDQKQLHEHDLVKKDIESVLANYGRVSTDATYEHRLGKLVHLKTDIRVQVDEQPTFEDLVHTLHPTPALGMFPRKADEEWFNETVSDKRRGVFGAPFGVKFGDESICLVAIRNIFWNNHFTYLYSGCGVVEASDLENEWTELANKRRAVKRHLGL